MSTGVLNKSASNRILDNERKKEQEEISELEKLKEESRQHVTRTHVTITLLLIWLLTLSSIGLMLFKDGFLLTRETLSETSKCDSEEGSCSLPPKFSKSIIVLVDALRYDFTAYDTNAKLSSKNYINKLPFIKHLIDSNPDKAILFESVADPPTTTLQRIKGLTVGTLPAFIDAGSNFSGSEIEEDNWLYQLTTSKKLDKDNQLVNRTVAFLGDDTWMSLYPNSFDKPLPFPSFNVWDLHTVDDGILNNFDTVFKNEHTSQPWDSILLHFLGVDHVGHRYGPEHFEMANKLDQMDKFLRKLHQMIDDDTLVMVFGDHGMNFNGDHGGESRDEVESALFTFAKKPLRNVAYQQQIFRNLAVFDDEDLLPSHFNHGKDGKSKHRSVQQIDIVPTISLLLGLPIPYSNLGMVIPEMLLNGEDAQTYVQALRLNALQINKYLNTFSARFPNSEIAIQYTQTLKLKFEEFDTKFNSWSQANNDDVLTQQAIKSGVEFIRTSLTTCRSVWAKFDLTKAYLGLFLMASVVAVLLYHVLFRSHPEPVTTPEPKFSTLNGIILGYLFVFGLFGVLLGLSGIFTAVLDIFDADLSTFKPGEITMVSGLLGTTVGYWMNAVVDRYYTNTAANSPSAYLTASYYNKLSFDQLLRPDAFMILFNITVVIIAATLNASVYMVNHEDSIVLYLLQTFTVLLLTYAFLLNRSVEADKLQVVNLLREKLLKLATTFLVLNQLVSYVTVCREEQMPQCQPTFYGFFSGEAINTEPTRLILVIYAVVVLCLPLFIKYVLTTTKNYNNTAPYWVEIGFRSSLVLTAIYWLLDSQTAAIFQNGIVITIKNLSARLSFFMALLTGLVAFFSNPLLLDVQLVRTDATSSSDQQLGAQTNHSMVVNGFGNAYGAPLLIFLTVQLAVLFIVQQPTGAIILVLHFVQLLIVVDIYDVCKDVQTLLPPTSQLSNLNPAPTGTPHRSLQFTVISLIYLLAQQAFFATGHQATVNSLQWKVGFVGLTDMSWYLSPILIVLNTVGPHLLSGTAVLLVVYWKVTPEKQHLFHKLPFHLFQTSLYFFTLHALNLLGSAICATYLRRHLEVWKLFTPRFITAAVAMFLPSTIGLIFLGLFFPSAVTLTEIGDILPLIKRD